MPESGSCYNQIEEYTVHWYKNSEGYAYDNG